LIQFTKLEYNGFTIEREECVKRNMNKGIPKGNMCSRNPALGPVLGTCSIERDYYKDCLLAANAIKKVRNITVLKKKFVQDLLA